MGRRSIISRALRPTRAGRFACTWQAGEAAVIAAALRVPVVSNFRPADMLAGGQGAPLVPLLDYVLFADAKRGRVLQNIGGIANLTAIPAGAAAMRDRFRYRARQHGDRRAGAAAIRQGDSTAMARWPRAARCLQPVLRRMLRNPYFRLKPPRTAGREQFGREYAAEFLRACRRTQQQAGRRAGHRDRADGGDDCAELRAICACRK